jgi:hypothetical protein
MLTLKIYVVAFFGGMLVLLILHVRQMDKESKEKKK